MKTKFIALLSLIIIFSCKKNVSNEIEEATESVEEVKESTEEISLEDLTSYEAAKKIKLNEQFSITEGLKATIENSSSLDFSKIENGNKKELLKLVSLNMQNENFQKSYFGECWDSRPKNYHELDYVEKTRKTFIRLNETNLRLLNIFNLIGFDFSRKNRLYSTELIINGKHICEVKKKIYDYFISVNILYKVKLKSGGIKISKLDQLLASIDAKKAEVEYIYNTKGIQLNPNSDSIPKYKLTGSGLFNREINLEDKVNYILEEISKKDGAYMGRPFPKDFSFFND